MTGRSPTGRAVAATPSSPQAVSPVPASIPNARHKHPKAWYRETKSSLRLRDGDVCWLCKSLMPSGTETIDHVVPISFGGSDELSNLRLAHHDCNRRRGNSPPEVAMAREASRAAKRNGNFPACGCNHVPCAHAIAMEARQGRDRNGLDPKDDSTGRQASPNPPHDPPQEAE